MATYLPLAAWHLIVKTAHHPPPAILLAVVGFFVLQIVLGRLRSGRWFDAFIYALVTTAIVVFVVSCVYILVTRSGFRFL